MAKNSLLEYFDLNGSGVISFADIGMVTNALGKKEGESGYERRFDFNRNGEVDSNDVAIISLFFGVTVVDD